MEAFPPGAWEFPRPNIIAWSSDLAAAYPTKNLNLARDRVFQLGRRLDVVNRVVMVEDDLDDDEEDVEDAAPAQNLMPPPPVPAKGKQSKAQPSDMDDLIEIKPPVSILLCSCLKGTEPPL